MNIIQFSETSGASGVKTHRAKSTPVCSPAILYVNDDGFACICAWCETRPEAEAWSRAQKLVVTHTICEKCRARLTEEYRFADDKWSA